MFPVTFKHLNRSVMMDYWVGKVAVVTGASAGMGAAIALSLANAGLHVVGLARRKDRIEALQAPNIHAIECDVSKVESIEAAFKEIDEKFGKIHVLINNAGRSQKGKVLDPKLSHQNIAETVNINFTGIIICTREATKLIEKHDDLAYIINVNSVFGHSSPSSASYANVYMATKHALTAHTADVRFGFLGKNRVRVASLSPGLVKTELFEAAGFTDEEALYNRMPYLEPNDIADAVHYLLSLPPHVNVSELTIRPTGERA